jgi:DNA repair protein RadC
MLNNASSLIVAHNHPSGDPKLSEEDVRLTRRLVKVGEILGVPLMDHVLIGRDTYRSLREEGIIIG